MCIDVYRRGEMRCDAKFRAFQLLNRLLDEFLPPGAQLTVRQGDAVHACAKKLAMELTNGTGEYVLLREAGIEEKKGREIGELPGGEG